MGISSKLETRRNNIRDFTNDYLRQLRRVSNISKKYKKIQEEATVVVKIQTDSMRKEIIDGESKHLTNSFKLLEEKKEKVLSEVEKQRVLYEKEVDKAENMKVKYNHLLNDYYKNIALYNSLGFVIVIVAAAMIQLYMTFRASAEYLHIWNAFFSNIDSKFYEATFQLIIALVIALFIERSRLKIEDSISWRKYSQFASGISWSIIGLITCLYILSGAMSNIFTFVIVASCLISLLYYAISPLWKSSES